MKKNIETYRGKRVNFAMIDDWFYDCDLQKENLEEILQTIKLNNKERINKCKIFVTNDGYYVIKN